MVYTSQGFLFLLRIKAYYHVALPKLAFRYCSPAYGVAKCNTIQHQTRNGKQHWPHNSGLPRAPGADKSTMRACCGQGGRRNGRPGGITGQGGEEAGTGRSGGNGTCQILSHPFKPFPDPFFSSDILHQNRWSQSSFGSKEK